MFSVKQNENTHSIVRWTDQTRQGSRLPFQRLFLIYNLEEPFLFKGESIPGLVAIKGSYHNEAGRWSSRTYRLALRKEAVACEVCAPPRGTVADTAANWEEVGDWITLRNKGQAPEEWLEKIRKANWKPAFERHLQTIAARVTTRMAAISSLDTKWTSPRER